MLLRINKNSTKSKAVSSYMLSGINIKRMIQDEMAENNVSDISIIRVSKRPIFKVRERAEKEKLGEREKDKEKEGSTTGNLPNKSFKIRSYTRKMKDGREEESCQIFEKVEKIRNCRNNSTRIELFNLSKQHKEKDDNEQRIQTKIKEILQREATIKCKANNNEVFVKQSDPSLITPPPMRFQQFSTQKYREVAHKVNTYFNPQFEQSSSKDILIVVSLEGIHIHSRKAIRSSNSYEEPIKNNEKLPAVSQEQIELLKMVSSKHYPDRIWSHAKVAFKVNNAQQMQELKTVLDNNHISDYFCIFFPIKRYVECWNLYQIDGLLQKVHSVILLEAKYKLKEEFPILNPSTKSLFIATQNDNFVILSRTLSAVKCFLSQTTRQAMSVVDIEDETLGQGEQHSTEPSKMVEEENNLFQFGIRSEDISINWPGLDARLQFTLNSREIKNSNSRHHNKSVSTSKDTRVKRRVLCERDNNCPTSASKNNRNISMNFNSASVQEDKWDFEPIKQESMDAMRENLLFCLRTERLKEVLGQNRPAKKIEIVEKSEKCDELDQITNYVRGSCCRSKTNHQLISELLKKNTAIHRQIDQYLTSIAHLPPAPNSISVSNFKEEEEPPACPLFIHAYKIF